MHTVKITNLPEDAKENDMYSIFGSCGLILSVSVIRSSDHASTAYVSFSDADSQKKALLKNGYLILGRCISTSPWEATSHDQSITYSQVEPKDHPDETTHDLAAGKYYEHETLDDVSNLLDFDPEDLNLEGVDFNDFGPQDVTNDLNLEDFEFYEFDIHSSNFKEHIANAESAIIVNTTAGLTLDNPSG